ncbi:MAG: heme biosynthesis HemY N-terminal domain-containing protein [Arenicellales bacterium]|nr:heme biosynthesis HemY N-terminal domain-containing protein [Arenicellales bacterium]
MTLIIFVLLVLAGGVTLALVALEDPGYVLISRAPYEIEISLALLILLSGLVLLAAYLLLKLIWNLVRAPRSIGLWKENRRHTLATRATLAGYSRLIEGEWEEAEEILTQRLGYGATPLLSCLGAAYAAQQRGDYQARDEYLMQARTEDPDHSEAVEITRARLLERAGQLDEARGVLEQLHEQGIRRRAVQGMLVDLLQRQQDWPALEVLFKDLKRSRVLPEQELKTLNRDLQVRLLTADARPDGGSLVWSRLSRRERRDPVLTAVHVRSLIDSGSMKQAEKILRKAIARGWNGDLVRLYGHVHSAPIQAQLDHAQGWRRSHPDDPDLLMTLARLQLELEARDEALTLLVEAARIGVSGDTYMELGLLLESLGESSKALQCYRRGLQQSQVPAAPARSESPAELLPAVIENA